MEYMQSYVWVSDEYGKSAESVDYLAPALTLIWHGRVVVIFYTRADVYNRRILDVLGNVGGEAIR